MDIEKFVSETLVQIAAGVTDANEKMQSRNLNAKANPAGGNVVSQASTHYRGIPDTQMISFDIAVTVETATATNGEAGVGLSVLKLGTSGESSSTDSQASRIQFTIPLKLPMDGR